MLPNTDIRYLKGVGEKRAEQLSALGVSDIGALLRFYPRAYEDWSNPTPIANALGDEKCCIRATVASAVTKWRAKSGIIMFKTTAFDESGAVQIIIFNNKYAAATLKMGEEYLFYGQVTMSGRQLQMLSPAIRRPSLGLMIRPIYKRTGTLTSGYIETLVQRALDLCGSETVDTFPEKTVEKYGLMPLDKALSEIHFPSDMESMYRARERFIFEELFELQIGMRLMRDDIHKKSDIIVSCDFSDEFYDMLPFEPTGAQRKAIKAAVEDIGSGFVMNRLVQGDVGSGKTMVAAALCFNLWKSGYQSAVMAPTEILARQHFETLSSFFSDTGMKIVLLTGKMSAALRREALKSIGNGEAAVVVGTHALISSGVEFNNLGLVVTDEQHRFGVRQRGELAEKGESPHVLVMSATPIPRTLALSIYGDLDVSVIDELPKGRIPVETYRINSSIRERAFGYIKKHLDEGRQAFIVCPMVEDGDTENVVSAEHYYEDIRKGAFSEYSVGLLHGQMKNTEKEAVMEKLVNGSIQLLVTTVVIEVGVDVPNAAIMLIENAERFGLSQLHQLRGRVGRGQYKSTCILLSDSGSENTKERLKTMCGTNDGFEIAKRDLALRGPGDFFGSRQHGLPELHMADMLENMDVLTLAGEAADELLKYDPKLMLPENAPLRSEVEKLFGRMESSC